MPISECTSFGSHVYRECSLLHQRAADLNGKRFIDAKDGDSDTANGRAAAEVRSVPTEMAAPPMAARVEQGYQLPRRYAQGSML